MSRNNAEQESQAEERAEHDDIGRVFLCYAKRNLYRS